MRRHVLLLTILALCCAFAVQPPRARAELAAQQTAVYPSDQSPTGYFATFRYADPQATLVRIRGEWSFSSARRSSLQTGENVMPGNYENGMFPLQIDSGDEWPIADMRKDPDTGVWCYTIPLPCGVWSYRFIVYSGESVYATSDPNNRPAEQKLGQQNNSQVYVPFDAARQGQDLSVQSPVENGRVGTLAVEQYDASGLGYRLLDEPNVAIYLPYGYDAHRAQPYKVLYALHGAGVESETSWWNKGAIGNMTDHLIAENAVEPFVIVMPNNYIDSFDYANLLANIVPMVEAKFNVRRDAPGKAICGISKGAICAKNVLLNQPEQFGYYGFFSGCYFSESTEEFDGGRIGGAKIYLGAGEREDGLIAMYRTTEKLASAGKTDFHVYTVMGGHNWYTWRQLYVDFVKNELWQ